MSDMFGCSLCSALCCTVPPEMTTKEEVDLALAHGASLIAVEVENKKGYIVGVIQSKDGVCPFLKDGTCTVYENRFARCREFVCQAQRLPVKNIVSLVTLLRLPTLLTTPQGGFDKRNGPALFSWGFVKEYKIPVVTHDIAAQLVNTVEMDIVMAMVQDTVLRASKHLRGQ